MTSQKRCFGQGKELYAQYHDEQWGVPVHDDQILFEMLILEGAQAGSVRLRLTATPRQSSILLFYFC